MITSPAARRARLAALSRHRPADDPEVVAARVDCSAAYALQTVRRLRQHLSVEQRAELAVVLLAGVATDG